MEGKIVDLISGIENRLDIIEELLDELEDNGVDVESFRDNLGKVWTSYHELDEKYS